MLVASDRLKSYLRTWGLGANTADDLLRTFPEASIRRQALWLPLRKPKTNPAGYLRRAIVDTYSAPSLSEDQRCWFENALTTQMLPEPDPSQRKTSEQSLDAWKDDFLAKREAEADEWYADRELTKTARLVDDNEEVPF